MDNNDPQVIPDQINRNRFGFNTYRLCIPSLNITTSNPVNIDQLSDQNTIFPSTLADTFFLIRRDNNTIFISVNSIDNNDNVIEETFSIGVNRPNELAREMSNTAYSPPISRSNSPF